MHFLLLIGNHTLYLVACVATDMVLEPGEINNFYLSVALSQIYNASTPLLINYQLIRLAEIVRRHADMFINVRKLSATLPIHGLVNLCFPRLR